MVSNVSPQVSFPPQVYFHDSLNEPISVNSLEHLMHDLYQIISEEEGRAMSNYSFAVQAERAWRDSLSKKLEEEQARLSSRLSAEGTIPKISNIVAPLCLVAEGIFSIVAGGGSPVSIVGAAAVALGGLLAVDATLDILTDHSAKRYLAQFLHRATNESEQGWFERISTTCGLATVALGVGLPGQEAVHLATSISQGVLECVRSGVHFSAENQQALITELNYSMGLSSRNMDSLGSSVVHLQDSPNDQINLVMQLYRSNSATITDIFS
jgi:hypothetical protein